MVAMDADHPGYGFADHKGYSTSAHGAALRELGPCAAHRYSYINVRRSAAGLGIRASEEGSGEERWGRARRTSERMSGR